MLLQVLLLLLLLLQMWLLWMLLLVIARSQQRDAVRRRRCRRLAVAETHQRLAHQVLVRVRVPLLLLLLVVRAQVVAAGTAGGIITGGPRSRMWSGGWRKERGDFNEYRVRWQNKNGQRRWQTLKFIYFKLAGKHWRETKRRFRRPEGHAKVSRKQCVRVWKTARQTKKILNYYKY